MNDVTKPAAIRAQEHWTEKDGGVKLFMFEKCAVDPNSAAGTILFVHGSSMASQPTFDLQVDGRSDSSVMEGGRPPELVLKSLRYYVDRLVTKKDRCGRAS